MQGTDGPRWSARPGLSEDDILTGQTLAGATGARPQVPAEDPHAAPAGSAELLALILSALDEDAAEDIVDIPLAGKSEEADHLVIASGRSSRHVAALSEKLAERLKQEGGLLPRIEGREAADWVLIDAGDVIVHIFRPEVREFYQLEKMWQTPADLKARAG